MGALIVSKFERHEKERGLFPVFGPARAKAGRDNSSAGREDIHPEELLVKALVLLALVFVVGCSSAPVEPERVPAPDLIEAPSETSIDIEGLKRSLGLDGPTDDLGYKEQAFNTCKVGYGYSSSRDCVRKVFAVVRFRLQCRDSVGTISTALGAADLTPIAGRSVRWTFAKTEGVDQTDGEGFAEALGIFAGSPRKDWLRLAVGTQFLHIRAGDITRIAVPRPWCEQ